MRVGGGDFRTVGEEFLGHFREFGELDPDHDVLDVGCGVGRMAIPLLGYLSGRGSYDGFDVDPDAIRWCTDNITGRNPRFRFRVVDVRNALYHPTGAVGAADLRFPFRDESFDFAFLTSVCTHMRPPEVVNYLREIARVLRPGGRCLLTWLLLNDDSLRLIDAGRSRFEFPVEIGIARASDPDVPERAIAYPEEWVREQMGDVGLWVREPLRYGSWCGRERLHSSQDIVVVERLA